MKDEKMFKETIYFHKASGKYIIFLYLNPREPSEGTYMAGMCNTMEDARKAMKHLILNRDWDWW